MKKLFRILVKAVILNLVIIWLIAITSGVVLGFDKENASWINIYLKISLFLVLLTLVLGIIIFSTNLIDFLENGYSCSNFKSKIKKLTKEQIRRYDEELKSGDWKKFSKKHS